MQCRTNLYMLWTSWLQKVARHIGVSSGQSTRSDFTRLLNKRHLKPFRPFYSNRKLTLFLVSLMTINTVQAQTQTQIIELPSIVGPYLYELYTDAKYFITRVQVNGQDINLSNAEGYGMVSGRGYGYNGPMGYPNKVTLNGFMRSGINEIRVIFEPSPVIAEAEKEGKGELFNDKILSHVLIVRSQLGMLASSGSRSDELTEALKAAEETVMVLQNERVKGYTADQLSNEISVSLSLSLGTDEEAVMSDVTDCSFTGYSSERFTGTLMLNSKPLVGIDGNSGKRLGDIDSLLKQGENTFELIVNEMKDDNFWDGIVGLFKDRKVSEYKMVLKCEMEPSIKQAGFPLEYSGLNYGSFFNSTEIVLGIFKITGKGKYTLTRDINMANPSVAMGCSGQTLNYKFSDEEMRQLRRDWSSELVETEVYYKMGEDNQAELALRKQLAAKGNVSCEQLGRLYAFIWRHIEDRKIANKINTIIRQTIRDQK